VIDAILNNTQNAHQSTALLQRGVPKLDQEEKVAAE